MYPSQLAGTVLSVGPGRRSLGRGHAADLRLDDPHLSSIHAALSQAGGQTSVEDLGSRNGTLVNGEPVRRPRVLHDGDVVQFGMVRARYEVPGSTGMMPPARPAQERPIRFDVDRQTGGQINNVGRDQYNHYSQQRESFLREVAAARTRARHLIWLSVVMSFGGGLVAAWDFSNTLKRAAEGEPFESPFSPVLMTSLAVGVAGSVLLWIALIMHIVTAARGKKVDSDPRHGWNAPVHRGRVGGWD
ncbi:FHA domain-containing protein [Microtetraspora sp. NBRC 16547]|uniref:FHA domain-containing protein n=1 Tax=Microtetraspora sp. NBRC 16547 TaxID=3030993 RepID=UPI0025572BDB|nr:FHA domain-containing protein [Microtetraspora sp. NBRC 16547]